MLPNRSSMPPGWSLAYHPFDLLQMDGKDLKDRPLRQRRALLERLTTKSGVLLYLVIHAATWAEPNDKFVDA
jgi:ATP-dependent DNA ligase